MKKQFFGIFSLLLSVLLFCAALVGCDGGNGNNGGSGEQNLLPTPAVVIDKNGLAAWDEIDGALYYRYDIDGTETLTTESSVQLTDGQTLRVMAVSGKEGYGDSPYSAVQTYSADRYAELSFYAVNDLHGKFMDTSSQPGLDEFTTYMKALYADGGREEVLLSSGDMWQGTVESSTNRGQLMTEWMNEMDFVSMTLGNHEYDWGAEALTANSQAAEFPFLAINVTYNGEPAPYCQGSTVVKKDGVTIGIIGAIGDCLGSISGEFQTGLSFATGDSLTALVKTEATRLRQEEGCEFIVYSIHDGGDGFASSGIQSVTDADMGWYDSSLSDGYVDLVFEGHTHKSYILKDEYGVYHLQGGGENRGLSCADVTFNTVTKDFSVTARIVDPRVYASSSLEDDPVVGEIFEKYFPDENPYTTILGTNRTTRKSEVLLDTVAELYYRKGIEAWGEQYDIVLGGGYLNTRSPYSLSAGNVTYADLFSLLPFDNQIVLGRIKGSDLTKRFLNSNSYTVYAAIAAQDVVSTRDYYIVVDSYTSSYKWNNITEIDRIKGLYARDLLADYIKAGNWAR